MPETEYKALVLSASSLSLYQQCKTKFYYGKILKLYNPIGKREDLDRGTLVHLILMWYYIGIMKKLGDRISLMQAIIRKARILCTDLEFPSDVLEKILDSFAQYVTYYTSDWNPIGVEKPFLYHLGTDEGLKLKIYAEGKIDLIGTDFRDDTIIADHKSLAQDRDKDDAHNKYYSQPTNQTKLYSLVTNSPNIVINKFGLQTSLSPNQKFSRPIVSHTPEMLEEFRQETIRDCVEIYLRYGNIDKVNIEEPDFELKNFPRNSNHCMFCEYKVACNTSPTMRSWKIKGFFQQRFDSYDIFDGEDNASQG